jgi:hypothetical protein
MSFQPFADDWDRQAIASREQWEWLAVEISELRRCLAAGDQTHDRLALILVDHLVEVILGREINARLGFQWDDGLIEDLRTARDGGKELPPSLIEAIDNHIDLNERLQLDRHFAKKTKFLAKRGFLTQEEQSVINRLHECRNDAYHGDKIVAEVVSDLVLASVVLAAELFSRHKPIAYVMATSDSVRVVTPKDLPGMLVEGLAVPVKDMATRFSKHASSRVAGIAVTVALAEQIVSDTKDALHPNSLPDDEFGAILGRLTNVSATQLHSWSKRATDLARHRTSITQLMVRYLNFDQALQDVEPECRRLRTILDWSEQKRLDEARGK